LTALNITETQALSAEKNNQWTIFRNITAPEKLVCRSFSHDAESKRPRHRANATFPGL